MRYVVTEYTPGYLADSEPEVVEGWDQAASYARQLRDELTEQGYQLETVIDDAHVYLRYDLSNPERIHDLGRVVEVTPAAVAVWPEDASPPCSWHPEHGPGTKRVAGTPLCDSCYEWALNHWGE